MQPCERRADVGNSPAGQRVQRPRSTEETPSCAQSDCTSGGGPGVYKRRQVSTPRHAAARCFTPMMKSTRGSPARRRRRRRKRTAWTDLTSTDAEQQGEFRLYLSNLNCVYRVSAFRCSSLTRRCMCKQTLKKVQYWGRKISKKYRCIDRWLNFCRRRRLLFWRQGIFQLCHATRSLKYFLLLYYEYT